MKLFLFTSLLFSANAFSLDGIQLSDCFKKAFDESIHQVKKYARQYPEDIQFEESRLCPELSLKDLEKIKNDLSEQDPLSGKRVPYEQEDVLKAKIVDLIPFFTDRISCYKQYTKDTGFIEKLVNSIPRDRNKDLVERAIGKIINKKSPKKLDGSLGDFDLGYCNN